MSFARLEESVQLFFSWFGNHSVLGIPLNLVAHLVVSALIAIVLIYWRKWKPVNAMLFLIAVTLAKEVLIDSHALRYNQDYESRLNRAFLNWVGFGLGWVMVHWMRRRRA